MLCPQEPNSSVFPSLTQNTVVLGFVCWGAGAVFLGQRAVFEYLKSCSVFYLTVVCRRRAVRPSPCLCAAHTVQCAHPCVLVFTDRCLLLSQVS